MQRTVAENAKGLQFSLVAGFPRACRSVAVAFLSSLIHCFKWKLKVIQDAVKCKKTSFHYFTWLSLRGRWCTKHYFGCRQLITPALPVLHHKRGLNSAMLHQKPEQWKWVCRKQENGIFMFSIELLGTDGELMRQRCWKGQCVSNVFLNVFPVCS